MYRPGSYGGGSDGRHGGGRGYSERDGRRGHGYGGNNRREHDDDSDRDRGYRDNRGYGNGGGGHDDYYQRGSGSRGDDRRGTYDYQRSGGSYNNPRSYGHYDNQGGGGSYDSQRGGGSYNNQRDGGGYNNERGSGSYGNYGGSYDNPRGTGSYGNPRGGFDDRRGSSGFGHQRGGFDNRSAGHGGYSRRTEDGNRGAPRVGGPTVRGGRGGGSRGEPPAVVDEANVNTIAASIKPYFYFYVYSVDTKDAKGKTIDSRSLRVKFFHEGLNNVLKSHGFENGKDMEDFKKAVFFEGTQVYCARAIPGLDSDNIPFQLNITDVDGATMRIVKVKVLKAPDSVHVEPTPDNTDDGGVPIEYRCKTCWKAFNNRNGIIQHCQATGHSPLTSIPEEAVPCTKEEFLLFANISLKRALSERFARWGSEFIDPTKFVQPTNHRGQDMGVEIYKAYRCEFGLIKSPEAEKLTLALSVDLRAKIKRRKSLLEQIYEDVRADINRGSYSFSNEDRDYLNKKWISETAISGHDKRTYDIIGLIFDESPDSLMVPEKSVSHAEYFKDRKNIHLKYSGHNPMVVVKGRNNMDIFLPPECLNANELDPIIKMQLPQVASFTAQVRNESIEDLKRFMIPNGQKSRGSGLLPGCGIELKKSVQVNIEVLPLPSLMAAGVSIDDRMKSSWLPALGAVDYRVNPHTAVDLDVVVVCNRNIRRGMDSVYNKIVQMVNKFNATYRLKPQPLDIIEVDNRSHVQEVTRYFAGHGPFKNLFVLDFTLPAGKASQDNDYGGVKHILSKVGCLSQFVNFKTHNHSRDPQHKKSAIILGGVGRQILSKCGVRIWWVHLPREIPLPCVFVGIDVFHSPRRWDPIAGKKTAKKSVAACIIQLIRSHEDKENHKIEIYSETMSREAGKEVNLGKFIYDCSRNALREWQVDPKSVIVWRDGVGEQAIAPVAEDEMKHIRQAYGNGNGNGDVHLQEQALSKDNSLSSEDPTDSKLNLAYIICQKRISTKFVALDGKRALKEGSFTADLQGSDFKTFYINGTAPRFSTPKPTRFIVVHNDFEEDDGTQAMTMLLPNLTWHMSHDYPNWSGPIKVPAVCQYAHTAAELAGGFPDHGDSIDHKGFVDKIHFL